MKSIYLNHINTYIVTYWCLNCIIVTIIYFDTILMVQILSIYRQYIKNQNVYKNSAE